MSQKFQLNIAMFKQNGEVDFDLSHFFSNQDNMLALRNAQVLPYFSQTSVSQKNYDLNLFKAVGFGNNFAKWQSSLQNFLSQQDFKTVPIEQWLHGAFYFIENDFTRSDKLTLSALHQAAVPVHIVMNMPKEQSEKIATQLGLQFPYPVSCISSNMKFEPLLNSLLVQFNRSLKGKIVMSLSEYLINFFNEARQQIKDTLEKTNLISIIRDKVELDKEFEKSITCFDDKNVGVCFERTKKYLEQFEKTFQIPVDKSIKSDFERFWTEGEAIINNFDPDSFLTDIEKKFKGDFGDNLLAMYKLVKFALNIKDGLFDLFDEALFVPLIKHIEKWRYDYQNQSVEPSREKTSLEMTIA